MASSTLSERTQLIFLSVLAVGLGYVFYLYYLGPLAQQVEALDREIDQLEAEMHVAEAVRSRLPQLKTEVRNQTLRLNHMRQVLPSQKETADVIRRVEELAVQSNLKILSFVPQQTVDHNFYENWPILVSLEGNYHNLGKFFERISQFTRIINVENLSIKGLEQSDSDQKTVGATCRATTFVYKAEAPLVTETVEVTTDELASN